jgi:hypothetical protein
LRARRRWSDIQAKRDLRGTDVIISYAHNFLFIHVIKVAGMSIEKALAAHDVRAPLASEPPEKKALLLQNAGADPGVLGLQRHATAKDVRAVIGPEVFQRLFKFAFVRNPWDFELSLYHFNLTHPEFPAHAVTVKFKNFEEYILSKKREPLPRGMQLRFIADDDNKVIVDFVGRFETLARDFAAVCAKIGVDGPALGHVNSTEHRPWQECYTPAMFDLVRDISRVDIEAFGYASDRAAYGL